MATRTLGDLRAVLRDRLGFASSGGTSGVLQSNLNSILSSEQTVLYWTHEWARLRRYYDTTVGTSQHLINYPTGCNPDRIRAISVKVGDVWQPPMMKGIPPEFYTTQDVQTYPRRWEPYQQIEFWPKADQLYNVRIFGLKDLDRFTQDGDYSTIDGDLILTAALGTAKAHYRHPDAALHVEQRAALLRSLKARSWGQTVFQPRDYEPEPLPKPVVI